MQVSAVGQLKLSDEPLALRCLVLTASLDSGQQYPDCLATVVGDSNGIGLGVAGRGLFTVSAGTLQNLLSRLQEEYPDLLVEQLGGLYAELRNVLGWGPEEQRSWALSIQDGNHVVRSDWAGALGALARLPEVHEQQVLLVDPTYGRAIALCKALGLGSERAVALLFDSELDGRFAITDSDIKPLHKRLKRIREDRGWPVAEEERLRVVANVIVGKAPADAMTTVKDRALLVAMGEGAVGGRPVRLTDLGIDLKPADGLEAPADAVPETRPSGEPQTAPAVRPQLRMLSDAELRDDSDDRLDFVAYADAIAALIDNPGTGTPLTVAINAPWGAGKSSLARMVQKRLEGKRAVGGSSPHITCWFNAWLHDEATDLTAAFASKIAQLADQRRTPWRRLLNPLPTSLLPPGQRNLQRSILGVVILGVALVLSVVALQWVAPLLPPGVKEKFESVSDAFGIAGASLYLMVATMLWLLRNGASAAKAVSDFVRDPAAAATAGTMQAVRDQLGGLIRQATPDGSRFVVFVDDLERCRPPRAVDILEVINQLMPHDGVVTVLMADMPAVAACAEIKYKDLAEKYTPSSGTSVPRSGDGQYGRLYLQKIIQVQFDLPIHPARNILSLVRELAVDSKQAVSPAPVEPSAMRRLVDAMRDVPAQKSSLRKAFGRVLASPHAVERLAAILLLGLQVPLLWAVNAAESWAYPASARTSTAVRAPATLLPRILVVGSYGVYLGSMLLLMALLALPRAAWLFWVPLPSVLSWLLWWPAWAWLASIAVAASAAAVSARRQLRADLDAEAETEKLADTEIRANPNSSVEELVQRLKAVAPLSSGLVEIAKERRTLQVTDDSVLRREAEDEVMRYLPPLPRSAKRLVNQLRLLLAVAVDRQLFGGKPELTARHLGKWVVLRERWPDLAQALIVMPQTMLLLEKQSGAEAQFAAVIKALAPAYEGADDLREFCRTGTRLGGVIQRLVRFEPAQEVAA